LQPKLAVTLTLPLLALDATDALESDITYEQGAAAWVALKVCPAMVNVPTRDEVVLLAATE
jgi:hypothetical protein